MNKIFQINLQIGMSDCTVTYKSETCKEKFVPMLN